MLQLPGLNVPGFNDYFAFGWYLGDGTGRPFVGVVVRIDLGVDSQSAGRYNPATFSADV